MKILHARFSDSTHIAISDLSECTGANLSEVARAALHIGLVEVRALASRDPERAKEFIAINNLKSK